VSGRRIWRATGLLAGANAAALGIQFLTTILVAREFGATAPMDAYTLAVSIPESLQYVLMLATLSIVFTPLFIDARTRLGEDTAWSLALSLLAVISFSVLALLPLLWLAMPSLMHLLAPGFAPATRALAVELADLILPGLLYYATAGVLLGICFAYHDFMTAAVNTVLLALLNLAAFGIFVLGLQWGVQGLMLGRLGALLIVQVLLVSRVYRLLGRRRPRITFRNPHLWRLLTYLPPYMFGAVSGQLQLIVNRSLISTLGAGSVAAWGYGQRLADIPMAALGAAVGAAYLPDFAALVAAGRDSGAALEWNRAVVRVSLILTPIAALLLALGLPLITVLFQRGAFDAAATQATFLVLAGLALGLPLRGIGGLIVRGMPALKSRRLPLILSVLSTGVGVALAFTLLDVLGLFGVALSVSIGDALFAVVGCIVFWRRLSAQTRETAALLAKIAGTALVAGAAAYAVVWGVTGSPPIVQVILGGMIGAGVWVGLALALDLPEVRALGLVVLRRLGRIVPALVPEGRREKL
jgi:putative peptidoglycan lipid II flippase